MLVRTNKTCKGVYQSWLHPKILSTQKRRGKLQLHLWGPRDQPGGLTQSSLRSFALPGLNSRLLQRDYRGLSASLYCFSIWALLILLGVMQYMLRRTTNLWGQEWKKCDGSCCVCSSLSLKQKTRAEVVSSSRSTTVCVCLVSQSELWLWDPFCTLAESTSC